MAGGDEIRVRRVGFRDGTDEDLAALHAVEAPIEAERRPDHAPQPVASYIAFARNLASQFEDHTWLAEAGGEPVATGACWSNAAGDRRVMDCDLFVRKDHRRRGIGSTLMALVCDVALEERRSLLTWSTFDAVPAGEAFSRKLDASVARVNRTSELRLEAVDRSLVERWTAAEEARRLGYALELHHSPIPEHLLEDAAAFHHIMQTQPRDDLDVGDVHITAAQAGEVDRSVIESGRERWTIFVRAPDGTCVGGTEIHLEPWDPKVTRQQNTGIDPAHRGLGLAKWAKAAMLEHLRRDRPEVERVQTGNAFSNAPMLAINDALGFRVISTRTEWQADPGPCRRLLHGG